MTQLMQQRPWAVWCLFLAGAVTGGITSSLMEPQHVRADASIEKGVEQRLSFLEQMRLADTVRFEGLSRDPESGAFVFKDDTRKVELLGPSALKVELLDPSDDRPALLIKGQATIEPVDKFDGRPALSVKGQVKLEPVDESPEKLVLDVRGQVALKDVGGYPTVVANDPLKKFALQVHASTDDVVSAAAEIVGDMEVYGSEMIVLPPWDSRPAIDVSSVGNWSNNYGNRALVRIGGPTEWISPDSDVRARMSAEELKVDNATIIEADIFKATINYLTEGMASEMLPPPE